MNQERYKNAVDDWNKYVNDLPDANFNKLSIPIQALVFKSLFFGQAADLFSGLTNQLLKRDLGVKLIFYAIYQRDTVSVVSEAYGRFNFLLNTLRTHSESLKTFKLRFSASIPNFNSLSKTTQLPQWITNLIILSNAEIDHTQHVSVLAKVSPNGSFLTNQSTNDKFLSAVIYKKFAYFVKQCDRRNSRAASEHLHSIMARTNNLIPRGSSNNGRNKTPDAVLRKIPCRTWSAFGHGKGAPLVGWNPSRSHSIIYIGESFDLSSKSS